jgi:hypothetical protein
MSERRARLIGLWLVLIAALRCSRARHRYGRGRSMALIYRRRMHRLRQNFQKKVAEVTPQLDGRTKKNRCLHIQRREPCSGPFFATIVRTAGTTWPGAWFAKGSGENQLRHALASWRLFQTDDP